MDEKADKIISKHQPRTYFDPRVDSPDCDALDGIGQKFKQNV